MNLFLHGNSASFNMKLVLFFLLILSNHVILKAQNCDYNLTVEVIDLHDSTPLKKAFVNLVDLDITGVTDDSGQYTFENLCKNTYTINVSHEECQTIQLEVDLKRNLKKRVRLEHHLNELDEIMVLSGTRKISQSLIENNISKDLLDDFNSRSLGDVLKTLSGVSTINSGNYLSKPMINGLHSSRVILINNNVRVEDQNWGIEHSPSIDINSSDKIAVIKGAGALQYAGDAVGGIIITETDRAPLIDSLYGNVFSNFQTNGRGGSISTNITKSNSNGWYSKFQTTVKRMGDFNSPEYSMTNTAFSERNFSFKAGLNRIDHGFDIYYSFFSNNIGILRSSHAVTARDIVNAINNQIPNVINEFSYDIKAPKQKTNHNLIKLKLFKNFDFGKLIMGYDFQVNDRKEYDIRRGDDRDKPASDLNLQTHSISLDLNSKLTNTSNVKAGISARYQKNFPDPDTGIRRIIPDYKKYDLSFYSIYDSKINELFQFESGLRFDYSNMNAYKYYRTSFWESRNYNELFPEIVLNDLGTQILTNPKFNFYNLSANIGANYKIGENKKIYFNYSMSSRNPNPSELFSEGLHHSAARIEIGDLRFNSEIGHNLSLSYELIGEKYNFTATSFINSINDYIYIMPTYLLPTIRGVFPVWEYRQENATLYGVDIKYDKKYNQDLSTGHQFSLIKGYLKNNNEPIINLPPANFKNYISYQFFNLNNLNISLESEYVFRQNEFPNNNFDVYIPTEETFELLDTSTPPNAYHLVNFNSSMEFILNRGNKLKLNFKVRNFFDTIYKDYLNRLRYFTHDLGRNFILSAKYSF